MAHRRVVGPARGIALVTDRLLEMVKRKPDRRRGAHDGAEAEA
jgi:hypothetical protein